jgi:hypothetical protein
VITVNVIDRFIFSIFPTPSVNIIICLLLSGKAWLKVIALSGVSGGELLEMRLLDKKWNRSFFYLPYVYQYLT